MKTYIDMFETYKGLFLASHRLKNRFKKYWGTTTLDGVEVFNKRMVVWPGTDSNKNVVKILKMFGMYANIKKAKFEGITNYYLWLNPAKMDNYATISKDIIVNHLNAVIPNYEFQIVLNYTDAEDPKKFNGWTSEQVSTWFLANYATLRTGAYVECRGNTLVAEAVGYYVPLDVSGNFAVRTVSATVTPIAYRTSAGLTAYHSGISVELAAKQISPLQEDDAIVDMMLNETDPNRKNKITTVFGLDADTDDDTAAAWLVNAARTGGIFRSITNRGSNKTNEIWYRGQLRTQILDSSYVDRDAFAGILASSMDTGYTKKKTKWWKKLLSIVIVVIAVVLSIPSGGLSMATLGTFAVNLGIATLVLTVVQFAIAKSGDVAWAQYFGSFVQIVGVVSMVTGVAAFIQNIAKRGLMTVITESFSEFTTEVASTLGIETAGTAAAGAEAGAAAAMAAGGVTMEGGAGLATAATKSLFGKAMDFLGSKLVTIGRKIAEYAMDQRVNTAREELGDATALAEQTREELIELTDREIDIAVEDIKYYTTPLKLDNLPFEVDYLYEGTKFNIGRPSFVPTGLNIIDK